MIYCAQKSLLELKKIAFLNKKSLNNVNENVGNFPTNDLYIFEANIQFIFKIFLVFILSTKYFNFSLRFQFRI